MVVRLKFGPGNPSPRQQRQFAQRQPVPLRPPQPQPDVVPAREIALAIAGLLTPVSTLLVAIAVWCFGQDLGVTRQFFVSDGPFSHWQIWFALAALFGGCATWLNRVGRGSGGGDNQPAQ